MVFPAHAGTIRSLITVIRFSFGQARPTHLRDRIYVIQGSSMSLRDKIIKLAYDNPELRGDLMPLIHSDKESSFHKNASIGTVIEHSGQYMEALTLGIGKRLPGSWKLGNIQVGTSATSTLEGHMDVQTPTEVREVEVRIKVEFSEQSLNPLSAIWQAKLSRGWTDIAHDGGYADIFNPHADRDLAKQLMSVWNKGGAHDYLVEFYKN